MAQTIIKRIILESGQKALEANCPYDPTIKPRRPDTTKEKQNEVDNLLSTNPVENSSEEDEGERP